MFYNANDCICKILFLIKKLFVIAEYNVILHPENYYAFY